MPDLMQFLSVKLLPNHSNTGRLPWRKEAHTLSLYWQTRNWSSSQLRALPLQILLLGRKKQKNKETYTLFKHNWQEHKMLSDVPHASTEPPKNHVGCGLLKMVWDSSPPNNAFQQSLSRRLNKGKAENVYQNHSFVIETLLIHHHVQFSKWGGWKAVAPATQLCPPAGLNSSYVKTTSLWSLWGDLLIFFCFFEQSTLPGTKFQHYKQTGRGWGRGPTKALVFFQRISATSAETILCFKDPVSLHVMWNFST